jgi:hypothetical protein
MRIDPPAVKIFKKFFPLEKNSDSIDEYCKFSLPILPKWLPGPKRGLGLFQLQSCICQ